MWKMRAFPQYYVIFGDFSKIDYPFENPLLVSSYHNMISKCANFYFHFAYS